MLVIHSRCIYQKLFHNLQFFRVFYALKKKKKQNKNKSNPLFNECINDFLFIYLFIYFNTIECINNLTSVNKQRKYMFKIDHISALCQL